MSQNEGLTWTNPFENKLDKVAAIFQHYFTHDELRTTTAMNTPTEPNTMDIPAFASQNNRETWKSIGKYVRNCQWARSLALQNIHQM